MKKDQANNQGFLRFFQTAAGRRLVFVAAGTASVSFIVGNFLPHTFGLSYYRDFVQSYDNGIVHKVHANVLKRVDQAMEKLKLHPYERLLVKPFSVVGFDLFQAGSTKYRFGALLGIPTNYEYSDKSQIKRSDIIFRGRNIDWESESGRLLEEAIVLTEDEQVFGMCKTILQLQTHRVLMNSIYPTASFLTMYTLGRYLNIKLDLYARPASLRLVMYSILGLFGLGSWFFMKDFTQVSYDVEIDNKLAELGPEFVATGVSYYDKVLKKNMALRGLLGDDTYTAKGNENYFIRQKSLPITLRKSFFEEKWREITKEGSAEAELAQ